ncbi:osmotically inducible protein OsmC [Pseudarcicella hirudinis]|uniref:Osmotically inducible protein OsmC n=1 Tax=Pseudarcicella hirudinis TaxID=1079859 RepID=A0A1I5TN63_9BACT|nr:OsmC family protein [Pseudarcicella hirudinis]SFP84321.1 osmotically inducible protein OsmC [Pseudarcicella hirudinis]
MQIKRNATAQWIGAGKDGKGTLTTQSGVLNNTQYSFNTRFEDGIGTNPEELVAAAHAGCFSMQLAFNLQGAGFTAESIDSNSVVILENGAINEVNLTTKVKAPGLDQAKFDELVTHAKENCPISKLLKATITLDAQLL